MNTLDSIPAQGAATDHPQNPLASCLIDSRLDKDVARAIREERSEEKSD